MSQANLAKALRAFFMGASQMQKQKPVLVGNDTTGVPDEGCATSYPAKVENGQICLGRLRQEEVAKHNERLASHRKNGWIRIGTLRDSGSA